MSESPVVPQETPLSQRLEQLDRQIADTVQQVVRDLHREMGESVRQSSQELLRRLEELRPTIPESFVPAEELTALVPPPPGAPPEAATDQLIEAVAKVDAETGQAEVLVALLEEGRRFASRTAFFLIREGQARGWAARGFEAADRAFEGLSFGPAEIDSWAALVGDQVAQYCGPADCEAVARRANVAAGWAGVVVPFVLRGQLSGALYADSVDGEAPPEAACLQLLTHAAAQALETASFRGPGGSPALRPMAGEKPEAPASELPEVEPLAPLPEVEAPAFEAPAAAEEPELVELAPGPEYELAAPAEELYAAPEGGPAYGEVPAVETPPAEGEIWAEDDDPTVIGQQQAPGAPPVAPEAIGQATVRLDVSALQEQGPAAPAPTPGVPLARPAAEQTAPIVAEPTLEPSTQAEFELEPEPSEEMGFELEPEPALEAPPAAGFPPLAAEPVAPQVQPPTQVMPPTQVQPPPDMAPPAPPRPAPPAARPPAPPGGTEVSPPTDLEGPGLAFAAQAGAAPEVSAGEEAKHEEARRLARLLVSEIKLYNEEVIEEGRRAGNIYSRLKEDIDRSRQMYQERIDVSLQGKADYFYQELVQRLAGGDPKLLGI